MNKFMKVGGTSKDGEAKGLLVSDDNSLLVEQKGTHILEKEIATNVLVEAGQWANVVSSYAFNLSSNVHFGVISSVNGVRFDLEAIPVFNGLAVENSKFTLVENGLINQYRYITKKYELTTSNFRLRLTNKSETDATFTIVLFTSSSDYTQPEPKKPIIPDPVPLASKRVVAPGEEIALSDVSTDIMTITDAVAFSVGIKINKPNPITVQVIPIVDGTYVSHFGFGLETILYKKVMNGNVGITKKYLLKTPKFSIALTNEGTTDVNVTAELYKSYNSAETVDQMNQKEFYGATALDRPNTYTVDTGAIYMATDTQEVWINTSEGWLQL